MFKFFRKYNKIILVVGAAFLMVAFLIQGTLDMFLNTGQNPAIGELDGETLYVADRRAAAIEMQVLSQVHPVLGQMALNLVGGDEPLTWLLMVRDAQRMGLSTSMTQVDNLLSELGLDEQALRRRAREMGISAGLVRQAVAHWIMLEQYRELMLGRTHVPPVQKLVMVVRAANLMQQAQQTGNFGLMQQAGALAAMTDGTQRLSEPLIEHFLHDQRATVAGEALLVDSARYLDAAGQPGEEQLQALFQEHRDDLPGEGEPYGFGYRTPTRVKLEYLAFPMQALRDAVEVEEVEALAYYEEHPEQFQPATTTAPADAEPLPYIEVRQQVRDRLTTQKARELASRMVRAAQARLLTDVRGVPEVGGYRDLPENFEPTPLRVVADELAERFGVRPEVHRLTDNWLTLEQLQALPDLGQSSLAGRPRISFLQYLLSARELEPEAANPLLPLRLQTQLPAAPLASWNGSQYLVRLTAAEPARSPESLDEVRGQVVEDARQLAAYEQLLKEKDAWLERARQQGFDALAEAENLQRVDVPPTPRREPSMMTGELDVPTIPGIGQSEAFVTALFQTAQDVAGDAAQPLEQVDADRRMGAVGVDPRLSLALYRVDQYQPLTRSQFQREAGQPYVASWINQTLADRERGDALSITAVAERLNYRPAEGEVLDPDELDDAAM